MSFKFLTTLYLDLSAISVTKIKAKEDQCKCRCKLFLVFKQVTLKCLN